jgi:hypothetical protein
VSIGLLMEINVITNIGFNGMMVMNKFHTQLMNIAVIGGMKNKIKK